MAVKKYPAMFNLAKKYQMRSAILALFLASTSSAYAADLMDAWHAAQSKDPSFSAARAGAEAGKKKKDQAKALKLPQVTATVSAGGINGKSVV